MVYVAQVKSAQPKRVNPFTPKISIVILFTVYHTVIMMLVL